MVELYKGLNAIYWIGSTVLVAAVCYVGFYHQQYVMITLGAGFLLCVLLLLILGRIAREKFKDEVMFCLYNCRANDYLDRLTSRMGGSRNKTIKSSCAYLTALGYDVLGDYEAMKDACLRITLKVHMSEYHRHMFTYYLSKDNLEFAEQELEALRDFAVKRKNFKDKELLEGYVTGCEYALKFKKSDMEGVEEYYTKMLEESKTGPLISRVSFSVILGRILMQKGDKEKAEELLKFAAANGGDTKYKVLAEKALAEPG